MHRYTARDVMSTPVITVGLDASVLDAIHLMQTYRISGVPVLDDEGLLAGIVTEGDILLKEAGEGGLGALDYARSPDGGPIALLQRRHGARVADLMAKDVVTVTVDTPVREIASLMLRNRINRVPVIGDGGLVGIVTRADVLAIYERPAEALIDDVRSVLAERLALDPECFEVSVQAGTVCVRGRVRSAAEARMVAVFLDEIDGVCSVDTSGLQVKPNGPAAA